MTSTFEEWSFETSGQTPTPWIASAETLRGAADAIRNEVERTSGVHDNESMVDLYGPRAMLLGFAIECVLKGRYVWPDRKGPRLGRLLTQFGKFVGVPSVGKSHDLLLLSRSVGVTVSAKERDILQRLSAFTIHAGRYPIPTNVQQARPRNVPGRGRVSVGYFSSDDFVAAEALYDRFRTELLRDMFGPTYVSRILAAKRLFATSDYLIR